MNDTNNKQKFSLSPWLVIGGVMTLITLVWVFGYPLVMEEATLDIPNRVKEPSLSNLFGTDEYGRDHLVMVTDALNISMTMTFIPAFLIAVLSGGFGVLLMVFLKGPDWLKSKQRGAVWLYRFLPLLLFGVYVAVGVLVSKLAYGEHEVFDFLVITEESMRMLRIGYFIAAVVLGALMTFLYGKRFEAHGRKDAMTIIVPVLIAVLVMPVAYYTLVHTVYWMETVLWDTSARYPEFSISTVIMHARNDDLIISEHGYLGYTAIGSFFFTSLSFIVLSLGLIPEWALKKLQ